MRKVLLALLAGFLVLSCDSSSQNKTDADTGIVPDTAAGDEDLAVDNGATDSDAATTDGVATEEDPLNDSVDELGVDGSDNEEVDTSTDIEPDGDLEVDNDTVSDSDDTTESIMPENDIPVTENDDLQPEGNDLDAADPDVPTDGDIPDEVPDSDGRYVIVDEVVIDYAWDLMWQKGNSATMSQYDAITYCENLSLMGWTDWRLPTISELRMIIEGCYYTSNPNFDYYCEVNDSCLSKSCGSGTCYCGFDGPAEDKGYCEPGIWDECGIPLWSSSLVYDHDPYAWRVDFDRGFVREENRYVTFVYARCVRSL